MEMVFVRSFGAKCLIYTVTQQVTPMQNFTKDPTVLKVLCNSKFAMRCIVNLLSHNDFLSRPPCADIISCVLRRGSRRGKYGGVVKTLWRSSSQSRSVFSTAGSFGLFSFQVFLGGRGWELSCCKLSHN